MAYPLSVSIYILKWLPFNRDPLKRVSIKSQVLVMMVVMVMFACFLKKYFQYDSLYYWQLIIMSIEIDNYIGFTKERILISFLEKY